MRTPTTRSTRPRDRSRRSPGARTTLILERAAAHAERALRAGVTSARGAGSIRGLEFVLRDSIAAGDLPGPRLIAAGTAIGSIDGHGAAFGVGATGPDALARETENVIDAGADVIKVVASEAAMLTTTGHEPGRLVFGRPELELEELQAIVATAHARGRRVMAHAQDTESVIRCARAGVDSIEHAWLAERQAIEAVAEAGCTIVPTLVVTDVNRTLGGLSAEQRARQDLIEAMHAAACRVALDLGVPFVAGTDTGEVGVTADLVWREIVLLAAQGLAPLDAIAAATSRAARLLGIDGDVGMLIPGLRADIVLVVGDPLADLSVLAAPQVVVQSGRVVLGA